MFFMSFILFSNTFFHTRHTKNTECPSSGPPPNNYYSISSLSSQDANIRRNLHEGILNKDQEDEMFIYGSNKSAFCAFYFFCYMFVVLTHGLMRLVMHWLLLPHHRPWRRWESFGQWEVSRKTFDLLCENCVNIDTKKHSVSSRLGPGWASTH